MLLFQGWPVGVSEKCWKNSCLFLRPPIFSSEPKIQYPHWYTIAESVTSTNYSSATRNEIKKNWKRKIEGGRTINRQADKCISPVQWTNLVAQSILVTTASATTISVCVEVLRNGSVSSYHYTHSESLDINSLIKLGGLRLWAEHVWLWWRGG